MKNPCLLCACLATSREFSGKTQVKDFAVTGDCKLLVSRLDIRLLWGLSPDEIPRESDEDDHKGADE